MITVISIGHTTALTIIQRNGRRVVLALSIEIETTPDRLDDIDSTTPVTFGIEEVPMKVAEKLISDHEGIVAHHEGKGLSGDQAAAVRKFVGRFVGTHSVE